MRDPRIDDLPEGIKPVAEHLGYAAAQRMVDVFPGYRLRIPLKHRTPHDLDALGDLAAPLCQHFGGEIIEVPLNLATSAARVRKIRSLAAEGLSLNEIAGRVGCTRRRVQAILSGRDVAPRQSRRVDDRQIDLEEWLRSDGKQPAGG